MLKHRLLMSALLIPATIGLFYWDHNLGSRAPVLFWFVMAVAARCVWELVSLARIAGYQPHFASTLAATWSLILIAWAPHLENVWGWGSRFLGSDRFGGWLVLVGAIAVLLIAHAVFRFPLGPSHLEPDDNAQAVRTPIAGREVGTLGVEFLTVIYIGAFLAITTQLRWEWNAHGYFALGALVVATKMGDVGAYTFGRLIGGPKMTPKLSPGKTWAGGVGHLVTAGLCSVAWLCWLGPMISESWQSWNVAPAAGFGVVVGFAGLIGDLAESLIKRDVGVKDAPALLPGFGGLLDLMDSLLLAGPVAYAMWHLLR